MSDYFSSVIPGGIGSETDIGYKQMQNWDAAAAPAAAKSNGLGKLLGDVGKGFLTGGAIGFLKGAGGGSTGETETQGTKKGDDLGATLAKAFLEREIRDRLMLSRAGSEGASAFQ